MVCLCMVFFPKHNPNPPLLYYFVFAHLERRKKADSPLAKEGTPSYMAFYFNSNALGNWKESQGLMTSLLPLCPVRFLKFPLEGRLNLLFHLAIQTGKFPE